MLTHVLASELLLIQIHVRKITLYTQNICGNTDASCCPPTGSFASTLKHRDCSF